MTPWTRRSFIAGSGGIVLMNPIVGVAKSLDMNGAANILEQSVFSGRVRSASLFVQTGNTKFSRSFGEASSSTASFLLGSISKPVAVTALMTLFDKGMFSLDDPVHKFIPEFREGMQRQVTVKHLLTHTSGLPDQLPQNAELRSKHAGLSEFVSGTLHVPLLFAPGTRYEYSSMAILLAAEIAQRLSGKDIRSLVAETVLEPLEMHDSALGIGRLQPNQMMQCQVEFGAVESGAGSADAKHWDWNSSYWRQLGAPWGGLHGSAEDIGKFLHEFLHSTGKLFSSETAELMIRNHNPSGFETRGLGFDVGMESSCKGCSSATFGHTGSTGTIAWADPTRDLICVVLTSLPARAELGNQHPRQLASDAISQ